jgi:hypothetical protein
LFPTERGTPHLYGNLEDRWLTPRLVQMGLDEDGMGRHSFRRFRKTWLRGARCLKDVNNFWTGHRPQTMSELYSHLHEEIEVRLQEAKRAGYVSICRRPMLLQMLQKHPMQSRETKLRPKLQKGKK